MKQIYFRIGGKISSVLLPYSENPDEENINREIRKKINQWKRELNKQTTNEAVWYNPWQHQFEEEPILGLLHEIRENFNLFTKTTFEAKKLADVTIRSGLDILTGIIKELTKMKIEPDKIEKYGTKYERENFEIKSSSHRFRLIFEQAVGKLIGENNKLVIFIDDLDRCSDDNILKLLEGIKLYLSTGNCIFVFGMDQRNVERALEKKNIHKEYLDKLFQSIIRIPLSNKYNIFIQTIIKDYFPRTSHSDLIKMLVEILEKNPRKVKNFLNSLRAYWEMRDQGDDLKIEIVTLFHYLRIFYEPIFSILERNPRYIEQLNNICRKESPNQKIEHFFNDYLKNPITDLPISPTSETDKVKSSTLIEGDLNYMREISLRYRALDKFKEYFIKYYESDLHDNIENENYEIILQYLGVIEK